jgi:hypothetical protein
MCLLSIYNIDVCHPHKKNIHVCRCNYDETSASSYFINAQYLSYISRRDDRDMTH